MHEPQPRQPRRILVIDDEPQVRGFLEKVLMRAGYEVSTAKNGAEGLYIFEIEPFDLILTDIFMPDQDGLEVLRDLTHKAPDIPVIVTSGGSPDMPQDFLKFAKALGADVTLPKPFDQAQLLDAIERLLADEAETSSR